MISVCMASYNGEKYIKEQIESILYQISKEDELIISDDGSTDGTCKIIESFNDNRILLLHNDEHCYTSNFENAIKNSKGDIVFLADQDDIWLDDKVEKVMAAFEEHGCDFVLTDAIVVDKNLNNVAPSYFKVCSVAGGFIHNLIRTRYVGACMAFNQRVKDAIIPFPAKRNLIAHDYWITCVAELKFKVCLIDEPLMLYRRHENNVSLGIEMESITPFKIRIKKRIYAINCLVRTYGK